MNQDQKYDISQILQDMRADYWRNLETVEAEAVDLGDEYLLVQIAEKPYALPAALCSEVLKLPRLVHVPRLPKHIRGIVNLRGEIHAVTDLRPLLGNSMAELNAASRLVVVQHGPIKTALLVDSVIGLQRITESEIEPLAEGAAPGIRDLFKGKVLQGDQLFLLLALEKLLARPELLIDQKGQGKAFP